VRIIAEKTDLLPVGMLIGPFSLMTKLVADPIVPVAMAGRGMTAEEDEGVRMMERCLEISLATVLRSARGQIAAGAKAVIVCEPAANVAYLSHGICAAGPTFSNASCWSPTGNCACCWSSAGWTSSSTTAAN
jgi:uroporphyrinogen-III decarboxylase